MNEAILQKHTTGPNNSRKFKKFYETKLSKTNKCCVSTNINKKYGVSKSADFFHMF